ncbi:MAG: biotin/lipoyl-binding protein [Lachnospiraceae bacterium]|nr:biotin/lipoyl-binding protein [Lachnospiraceae bacterium]
MSVPYRRAAMDKHSSPDRLDTMIRIIPTGFWAAVAGGCAILIVVFLWSILGRLPVDVQTTGIYMSRDGIHTVYSKSTGIVEEVYIKSGDEIKRDQIIARLDSEEINDELSLLNDRRQKVAAVTLDSTNDIETADNQALMSLKANLLTISANLSQNEKMLEMRKAQLNEQQAKTNESMANMQLARNMYYASMNVGADTREQLEYQTAQSNLSSAVSLHESAKASLTSFRAQYSEKMDQYERDLEALRKKKKETTDPDVLAEINTNIKNLQDGLDQLKAEEDKLEEAVDDKGSARGQAENWAYSTAQKYIDTEQTRLAKQTFANQQSDNYNLALTDYNTQLSLLRNLEEAVSQLDVTVDSQDEGTTNQYEALKKQFDSAKATALDNIDMQIRQTREMLDNTLIRSSLEGYVIEVDIAAGNPLQPGMSICDISQTIRDVAMNAGAGSNETGDEQESFTLSSDNVIICYVPATDGRKIRPGMEVKVYPTTVNKEEYGHMSAVVSSVAEYVTSREMIMNQLGDETLTGQFLQKGAVIEVTCELEKDPDTISGYKWSSKKGAEVAIDPGTLVTTDTVIEEKPPIDLVIPYVKEKIRVNTNYPFGVEPEKK